MLDLRITLDGGPIEPADLCMWASTANDPSVRLTVEFASEARTRVSECATFKAFPKTPPGMQLNQRIDRSDNLRA